VLTGAFIGLGSTDPATNIGWFAVFAVIGAFASSTQDIAIDAWRIDVADERTPVELLSAVYQFGFRTASIIGGAFALFLAARIPWGDVFYVMAGMMVAVLLVALWAPDTERPTRPASDPLEAAGEVNPKVRYAALAIVCTGWAWAIITIGRFMVSMLTTAPGAKPPSVADFTGHVGPWIIVVTVLVPLVVAAGVNWLKKHGEWVQTQANSAGSAGRSTMNHVYGALVSPLAELSERLGWGVLIIIGFILTYALCYNIWSSFAFPFYLDYLHYTKDQVAIASKVFGIFMTMIGISLGGYLFGRIGRFPTVLIGAAVTPFGNLIYSDLADGGPHVDAFARVLQLPVLVNAVGRLWAGFGFSPFFYDPRMARLLLAICYENVATGIALTAFVAYLSGIISKKYTAVQYALLSSLTFLVGALGRGFAGESFDKYGYAIVFRWTAAAGLLAVVFVLLEWWRVTAQERRGVPIDADTAPKVPETPRPARS
jgi:PAT family beta-lactamase induction signal transducer AmpG